jgi:bifunctional enzyme CysN/CysC/sulfate adenylyltransferase subunit 1
VDVNTGERLEAAELGLNDIAEVELETSLPLFFDPYAESRAMGSFILIDPVTNATVAAAMIVAAAEEAPAAKTETARRFAFVLLGGEDGSARALALRDALIAQGRNAVVVDDGKIDAAALPAVARALELAGVIAISARADLSDTTIAAIREVAGESFFTNEAAATDWFGKTEQE